MRFYLKLLLIAVLAVSSLNVSAQIPSFREQGYKGSVSLTDHLGVFVGAETSHGFMLDNHNYLGLGVGGFVFPNADHPTFMNVFLDYQNYLMNKASTPTLGMKAGFAHAFNYEENVGIHFKNAILLEPNVGWSWGLKSGKGLSLGLGASLFLPVGEARTDKKVLPMPKISFAFEF